jgi:glycosyltransferase involved in cell wall biosynthesis
VVPCFNESERWNTDYWANLAKNKNFRWTFVDDGSHDATPQLISEVCHETNSDVMLLPRNYGKAEAVRLGLLRILAHNPEATAIGFMDADGAFDIHDIERIAFLFESMSNETRHYDAVWSSRVALSGRQVRRSPRRHYLGRIAATLISLNDPDMPYDTQSGFKLFEPTAEFKGVLQVPFLTRWLFEVEMLIRFRNIYGKAMKVWEEPLYCWHDVPGSKVSGQEMLRIGREILTIKRLARSPSHLTHHKMTQFDDGSQGT